MPKVTPKKKPTAKKKPIIRLKHRTSASVKIIQKDDPLLRTLSKEIPLTEIKTAKTKKTILDLKRAMQQQQDAVAIAAVQIGVPVRLFIISKRVFQLIGKGTEPSKDLIFINPKIIRTSKDKQSVEEGCLSVKYVYGNVERPDKVTIEAYDETGKKFSRGFSGFLAQAVQHETDHLNGILFTDKAKDVYTLTKEEYEKNLAEIAKH